MHHYRHNAPRALAKFMNRGEGVWIFMRGGQKPGRESGAVSAEP